MTDVMHGSSIAVVKSDLLAALAERPNLGSVRINGGAPTRATELRNEDGTEDALWLFNAEAGVDVVTLKSLPLEFDESYTLDVVIQVMRGKSDSTQAECDQRAVEILGELFGALATTPTLNITLPDGPYRRIEVTPSGWRHTTGRLVGKPGFGSRFDVDLAVEARLALS